MFELPDMTQKQTVTVTATTYSVYSNQNPAQETSTSFDLTFEDACLHDTLITLTPTAQTTQLVNNYNGQTVTFTYSPYTVTPEWCDVTVTCVSVSTNLLACQDLDEFG